MLKRPSSSSLMPSMKKPASHSSIKEVVSEPKGNRNQDKEAAENSKFHKMLSQGSLPEHIVHMLNIEAKKSKDGA